MVLCDYYVKEWYSFMLYKLSNGEFVTEEQWEMMQDKIKMQREIAKESSVVGDLILKEIPYIVNKRQSQDYNIMHYRMIKDKIIDFTRWPSKQLPIIFVDGDSQYVDGKQYTKSFIHEARDAQKFINYVGSEVAAEIKNRRREQWVGTPDNIIGNEQMWRNPELQMGILIAKPDPKTGLLPQKVSPWDMSQEMLMQYQRGNQDIREIMGFSEGQSLQGRDISGVARRERKVEGSMSSYVFQDNLNQAIEQAGRVVLDLLPVIYGGDERHVIISKTDGKTKSMILNKQNSDGSKENELSAGEYDIEIDTGPSFAVQKEIALEFFQQTIAANPQTFNLIADLWAKNLDIQFMPQVAERFKLLVPPEVLAKEAGEPPPPPKPDPQAMMMQQQMKMAEQEMAVKEQKMQIESAQLQERAQELEIRKEKHQLEKLEMLLKAKEMAEKNNLEKQGHRIDMHKTDVEYATKIASLLADLNNSHHQREHEKDLSRSQIKESSA
jgi:hypothetical protein